jgi:hypothetical protein
MSIHSCSTTSAATSTHTTPPLKLLPNQKSHLFTITYSSGTPCTPSTFYATACTCLHTSYVPLSPDASTAYIVATISGVPWVEERYYGAACGCVGVRVVPVKFAAEVKYIGGEIVLALEE